MFSSRKEKSLLYYILYHPVVTSTLHFGVFCGGKSKKFWETFTSSREKFYRLYLYNFYKNSGKDTKFPQRKVKSPCGLLVERKTGDWVVFCTPPNRATNAETRFKRALFVLCGKKERAILPAYKNAWRQLLRNETWGNTFQTIMHLRYCTWPAFTDVGWRIDIHHFGRFHSTVFPQCKVKSMCALLVERKTGARPVFCTPLIERKIQE